jgi:23S rRNA (cytosine1962-C5)-methyltransferase
VNDYELLDFGNGRRLERFGTWIFDRPCPAAENLCPEKTADWNKSNARFVLSSNELNSRSNSPNGFHVSKNSERGYWTSEPDAWLVQFGQIKMELCCTPFGHVGVFPEQQINWKRIAISLAAASKKRTETIHVLNLFAYTGGSSLAAALAAPNVAVVHVDSAGSIVDRAKRNAQLNHLDNIRFITDDVRKFVRRELKRGHYYDAVILDPPSYGHGLKGEAWKLTEHLPALLSDISGLLSHYPCFILLTAHTPGFNVDAMRKMIDNTKIPKLQHLEKITMNIPAKTGKQLESGYGIWATFRIENEQN